MGKCGRWRTEGKNKALFLSVRRKQGISVWRASSVGSLWLGYNKKNCLQVRPDQMMEWTFENEKVEEEEALWGRRRGGRLLRRGGFAWSAELLLQRATQECKSSLHRPKNKGGWVGKRRREREELVKPECDQANHIMSSGLYDLLICKSYWRRNTLLSIRFHKGLFDF